MDNYLESELREEPDGIVTMMAKRLPGESIIEQNYGENDECTLDSKIDENKVDTPFEFSK